MTNIFTWLIYIYDMTNLFCYTTNDSIYIDYNYVDSVSLAENIFDSFKIESKSSQNTYIWLVQNILIEIRLGIPRKQMSTRYP